LCTLLPSVRHTFITIHIDDITVAWRGSKVKEQLKVESAKLKVKEMGMKIPSP
jgi:hypothetical protein